MVEETAKSASTGSNVESSQKQVPQLEGDENKNHSSKEIIKEQDVVDKDGDEIKNDTINADQDIDQQSLTIRPSNL